MLFSSQESTSFDKFILEQGRNKSMKKMHLCCKVSSDIWSHCSSKINETMTMKKLEAIPFILTKCL
jgi:hypothetical protein